MHFLKEDKEGEEEGAGKEMKRNKERRKALNSNVSWNGYAQFQLRN